MEAPRDISSGSPSDGPEMVYIRMSHPKGSPIAEFEMPMTDAIRLFLDAHVFKQVDAIGREPNARLAASLDEAARLGPRFATAQELFDALEKRRRT